MKKSVILLLLITVFPLIGYCADANLKLKYQGFLQINGQPVNGTKGLVFRIRNGAGGAIQWESDCADIAISSGIFRTVIGETSVTGNWSTIDWGAIDAYLEVQMGNSGCGSVTSLNSTEQIMAVPYTLSLSSNTTLLVDNSTQTVNGELNIYGDVGVGTVSPASKLDVVGGTLTASGFQVTASSGNGQVPPGLVGFFNLSSCPGGWSEYTSARGRYIVGLPSGGTLNAAVGNVLSDRENRATGIHTHTISPNPHSHSLYGPVGCNQSADDLTPQGTTTGNTSLSIGVQASSVANTNAPYIQYLVCVKN